jgi:hypothetical protein
MKRLVGVFSGCVALAGAVAMTAVAADNFKTSGSFSYLNEGICADPVQVDGTYDETIHVFSDKAGNATRLSFTGKVKLTYTNLKNGSKYSPNTSGPATTDLATGQTVFRGGGTFDTNGRFVATNGRLVMDAYGHIISITGHQTDVCAVLGSSPAP